MGTENRDSAFDANRNGIPRGLFFPSSLSDYAEMASNVICAGLRYPKRAYYKFEFRDLVMICLEGYPPIELP